VHYGTHHSPLRIVNVTRQEERERHTHREREPESARLQWSASRWRGGVGGEGGFSGVEGFRVAYPRGPTRGGGERERRIRVFWGGWSGGGEGGEGGGV